MTYEELLPGVVEAAHAAGERLLKLYDTGARPADRAAMFAAAQRNEEASLDGLPEALRAIRPGAGWVDEDHETVALPPGEWWTVDAVEGNVNHVHGLPEWCVSITLLADNEPVLAVVHHPVPGLTYTAVRGEGARVNGVPLRVSGKTGLDSAIVTTSQSEAGRTSGIGASVTAMLGHALLVRATVPSTFPILLVASGQYDVFWQYEPVLPGIAAGALLVTEAGGVATDTHGQPWRPGRPDILLAAPGLHAAAVAVLAAV